MLKTDGWKLLLAAVLVFGLMAISGVALAQDQGGQMGGSQMGGQQGGQMGGPQGEHHEWWENMPMPPEVLHRAMKDTERMRREFSEKTVEYREALRRDDREASERLNRDLRRLRHQINDRLSDVEDAGRRWRDELRERYNAEMHDHHDEGQR